MATQAFLVLALFASSAFCQPTPPNSFPHAYPGEPTGELSPEWQRYFEVKDQLPNVTFPLTRSFAGNIPVNRAGHPNDTLFFWAFEHENGSLTTNSSSDPWLIWLQGGPGSSSMGGLLFENGPLRLQNDDSVQFNNFTWAKLVDSFWVDNPVGVGFATADSTGYVLDDDQMGSDFVQFLANLVKVFPSLATRPLYLAGESYAGRWVPYVTKAIFSTPKPPVKLAKIAIGDGTVASFSVTQDVNVVTILETYPQIVDYDTDVLTYFREQSHLCGYDLNFTYPESGKFKALDAPSATDPNSPYFFDSSSPPPRADLRIARFGSSTSLDSKLRRRTTEFLRRSSVKQNRNSALTKKDVEREERRQIWKRDLSDRANGTIDPWYACNLLDEMYDYMVNFTFPWNLGADSLDVYDVPDALLVKPVTSPATNGAFPFFLSNQTVTALHAPTSKQWVLSAQYPFNSTYTLGDISPDPMDFLDELAANASALGVGIVLYSGNDDSLIAHRGTEATIQNTTFGGVQGFSRMPSTPWFDDDGKFAGIVHQERNWTYVLFDGASHLVPQKKPAQAFVFLREFFLGKNQTGLVVNSSTVPVIGGESRTLTDDVLPGTSVIFIGSLSTQSTVTYPAATVSAWNSFVFSTNAPSVHEKSSARSVNANATSCVKFVLALLVMCIAVL